MAKKAFIGPLNPEYAGGVPLYGIRVKAIVVDNNNVLFAAADGSYPQDFLVEFQYNDTQLEIKQHTLQAVRDRYNDQTIKAVYLNDLSGILNLL